MLGGNPTWVAPAKVRSDRQGGIFWKNSLFPTFFAKPYRRCCRQVTWAKLHARPWRTKQIKTMGLVSEKDLLSFVDLHHARASNKLIAVALSLFEDGLGKSI